MQVLKRNGKAEAVHFDKITSRVMKLSYGLHLKQDDIIEIAKKVIIGIYNNVTTTELDNLAAETAASFTTKHPDFAVLAARIAVSNLHKNTIKSFSETAGLLYHYIDQKTGEKAPLRYLSSIALVITPRSPDQGREDFSISVMQAINL